MESDDAVLRMGVTPPPPHSSANAALLCSSIDRAPSNSIAVRLIPGAGRGVVALADIPKGTIVFEEEPYIMIPMANRRRLAVCICCGEQVVDKDRLNKTIVAAGGGEMGDGDGDAPSNNSSFASKAVADHVESSGGVMCDGGCGECYCSKECMDMFHTRSHINTGTCAALRLCRPAMPKLNTVDYNHLRAMVALGMKAKSEGVAGGFLRGDPAAGSKKKKKSKGKSDSDDDDSSSVTEDSDWDDLPNWKRNKLVAERKAERKAARAAAGEVEEGTILPIHIKGIQTKIDAPEFDGSTAKFSVIDVLDDEESAAVTKRRARVQNVTTSKRPTKAPVDEPLEVVCDALVAAQMPSTVSSTKSRHLDDYYLTVDIQHAPKDPTFATAIAPLVTNYSDFVEEQLDSFRDVYNAYCDLFPAEEEEVSGDSDDSDDDNSKLENGGDGDATKGKDLGPIKSIHDVVDLTTLPVFSEYMFLKISAAFQCNGFSIYNTSLRRTHDREVGIGKDMLAPSAFHLANSSADGKSVPCSPNHQHHSDGNINSATVSPMITPFSAAGTATPEIAQLTSSITPQLSMSTTSPTTRAANDVRRVPADDRSATPVRDLELLTGVYGYAAYFNHACAPNIKKTFGGPRGRTLQFVTLRNITKGDQICISYCGDSATTAGSQEVGGSNLKRWRLQKQYYFLCCCPICERKK